MSSPLFKVNEASFLNKEIFKRALQLRPDLKVGQFATGVGVSPKTIDNWINHRNVKRPSQASIPGLANFLQIDLVDAYEALGFIDLAGAAEKHVRDGVSFVRSSLRIFHLSGFGAPRGALAIIEQARAEGFDAYVWTDNRKVYAYMWTDNRKVHNLALREYVGVSRDGKRASRRLSEATSTEWTRKFELSMRAGPALLEDRHDALVRCRRRAAAEAWFWLPKLHAYRSPRPQRPGISEAETQPGIEYVLVVGNRLSGADRIAALLARQLDFGHVNSSMEAHRIFGREDQSLHAQRTAWVTGALLEGALGSRYVIAHGSAITAAQAIQATKSKEATTLLIFVEAGPRLTQFAREATEGQMDTMKSQAGIVDFTAVMVAAFDAAMQRVNWLNRPVKLDFDVDLKKVELDDVVADDRLIENDDRLLEAQIAAFDRLRTKLSNVRFRGSAPNTR